MKWGIVFSSTTCPDPERAAALGELAEEAGFESLWAPEHVVIPVEYEPVYEASPTGRLDRLGSRGGVPDPLIWFAYVAARTSRIRFGTGVVILPEHNPVAYAKTCATLATLSQGRFMLGVGVGWCREEYEALDEPWPHRGRRCEEYIEVLRRLWREPEAAYDGRFVRFPAVQSDPKPPGGTIPILIGGTSSAAAQRAGRIGDGYFPAIFPTERVWTDLPPLIDQVRAAAIDAGRDPSAVEITSGGVRTAEGAKWFADLGVHRLTVAVRARSVPEMRDELSRFGYEVIGPTESL
jgi:probable F420-dependent oxidoreductase